MNSIMFDLFRTGDIVKSILPSLLAFFALICGVKIQHRRENRKEQVEIYIRNGLENQIVSLTRLKENLVYNCLMYPVLFRGNKGANSNYFYNKLQEMYSYIEPNIAHVRMNIFGSEFCQALESLNLLVRKQLYNLEILSMKGVSKKEEFALIVFETEAILQYVIVKFTSLLNIMQTGIPRYSSMNNISNLHQVKTLREELKLFSENCIKLLGAKDKEQIWDFLRTTVKITRDRFDRMGILVEALNIEAINNEIYEEKKVA